MIFRTLITLLLNVLVIEHHSLLAEDQLTTAVIPTYQSQTVEGWTVHVAEPLVAEFQAETEKALEILRKQLQEVDRVVPAAAVVKLKEVPLWFSREYPGIRPGAEYHPGRQWLVDHGRNPEMVQGVEFTDIAIFEVEVDRMPNFVLHELAHAYHDRVLSYENPEVVKAFDRAKESHTYDSVERWNGSQAAAPKTRDKAYAMSNPMEYFAESSEAYFGRNDFYPFNHEELLKHDPGMAELLAKVWGVEAMAPVALSPIGPPLEEWKVPEFYTKSISANGYPVVASANVNDYALREAAYLINLMLANRPDVRDAMIKGGSRMCIISWKEFTTDLPDFAWLTPKDFWDARARGTGGSQTDPYCSSAEENILKYPGDPYSTECILMHEFAHNIHLRGMVNVDPSFDSRVQAAYDSAISQGLWKGKYASTNHHEYFAEGVQSWFDNNRPPDHDHNEVRTRKALKAYDPGLAKLCEEVFGETELVYTDPTTRLTDHLQGYDPSQAPTFVWPERLMKVKEEIRAAALKGPEAGN